MPTSVRQRSGILPQEVILPIYPKIEHITRYALFFILALVSFTALAQDEQVIWQQELKDNGNGNYTLVIKAEIADGWHIYDGTHPFTPTTIQFTLPDGVTLEGETRALSKVKPVQDEFFGSYGEYEGEALFEQDVKLSGEGAVVDALVSYQACTGSKTSTHSYYKIHKNPSFSVILSQKWGKHNASK